MRDERSDTCLNSVAGGTSASEQKLSDDKEIDAKSVRGNTRGSTPVGQPEHSTAWENRGMEAPWCL